MTKRKSFLINLRSMLFFSIKILDALFKIDKNKTSILAYHGISESPDLYSITASDFKNEIDKIKEKAKFINLDQSLKIINGKQIKGRNVILTFDDGYENVLSIAQYLKKANIKPALFVLADSINVDRKEIGNSQKFLSIKQIKYLKKQGWIIGCHSATHRNFNQLSKKQIQEEIVDSKRILQKKLGFEIEYFAFPKGNYNKKVLQAVEEAGYKGAFSTNPGSIKKGISKFIIPRTVINKSYLISDFPTMISPVTFFLRNSLRGLMGMLYSEA